MKKDIKKIQKMKNIYKLNTNNKKKIKKMRVLI